VDLTSLQTLLLIFELCALALGAILVGRLLNLPGFKPAGRWSGRLPYWPVEGAEMVLLIVLFLLLIIVCQGTFTHFFGRFIQAAADRKGLEVAIYGFAFHAGGLLAWPIFYLVRHRLFAAYNTNPPRPTETAAARGRWPGALRAAGVTFLSALPLVALVSVSWTGLLHLFGWPSEAQDMLATFQNTRSPIVIAGMFFVACVLAPINEELFFRRGLYHFLRQRFGRVIALAVSAGFFGLVHGNLAGFLPLAIFGVILALAYERTGDIRVSIIAHGLFNLNTIVALLSGLSG